MDIKKLKTKIKETAIALVLLKKVMRESGQPNVTYSTYRDLRTHKQRATILCSLRAHSRGGLHLGGSSLEDQAELIRSAAEEFEHGEPQATAA